MNEELHLFILWSNTKDKKQKIISDIKENLQIVECIEIEWSKNSFKKNLMRFYGVKVNDLGSKMQDCGTGALTLVTVIDHNPKYEYIETSRGFDYVNLNMFLLKQKYREWTNGGAKIHATNSTQETNHDITLLLGKNYNDYISSITKKWDGNTYKIKQDLVGNNGWKNLKELFYTLNATNNYVVLRGLNNLEQFESEEEHGDIDIYTDEYDNLSLIVNGTSIGNIYRPHYLTKIGNENVILDIWNDKNNYYDKNWSKEILNTRELQNGFYVPNKINAFYELIYHCLIHKLKIAKDYYKTANELYIELGLDKICNIQQYKYPFDLYYHFLLNFMKEKNYSFVKPKDESVIYNENLINFKDYISWLEHKYPINKIEPFMININNDGSEYVYFIGYYNNTKLFIKWGGVLNSAINEYKMAKALYDLDNEHFIKPYFYYYDAGKNFVAFEYVNGIGLNDLIEQNKLTETMKQRILPQLEKIAEDLYKANIVHRDIRPKNFILIDDKTIKLIDLQFAINYKKYWKDLVVRKKPYLIRHIGGIFAKGHFDWDDMYSFTIVLSKMDLSSDSIKNLVGKRRVRRPLLILAFWSLYFLKTFIRTIKKFLKK